MRSWVGLNVQEQIAQPAERETAVPARKTPPPVVQHVMVFLRAYCDRHEFVLWCSSPGFTSSDEIGSGSADGVFDDIRDEGGED